MIRITLRISTLLTLLIFFSAGPQSAAAEDKAPSDKTPSDKSPQKKPPIKVVAVGGGAAGQVVVGQRLVGRGNGAVRENVDANDPTERVLLLPRRASRDRSSPTAGEPS